MNKIILKSTMLIVASIGVTFMAQAASANTSGTTDSSITFTAGSLSIAEAPANIEFGSHKITSEAQSYSEVDSKGELYNSSVTVTDYRGQTTDGWSLTAAFESPGFSGMSVELNPAGGTGTSYATFNSVTLNDSAQTVATVPASEAASEDPSTTFTLGAEIKIPQNTPLAAQTYTKTIDWNLQSVIPQT